MPATVYPSVAPARQSGAYSPIDALRRHAIKRPDFVVMSQGQDNWTYERFANAVRRLSSGFIKHGVKRGDRIVLHIGNSPAAALACYAAIMIGAIVFPMNCRYAPGEVKRLIERLRPALYIGHGDVAGSLSQVETALLPVERRFIIDGTPGESAPERGVRAWDALFDTQLQPWPEDQDPDAPIILVSTSGTTAEPKLVAHTKDTVHHTIAAMVDALKSANVDITQGVDLAATPMFHSPGWRMAIAAVSLARKLVWPACREFDANVFLDEIERHRCAVLLATPAGIAELIKSQRAKPRELSCLAICVASGDASRAELYDEFRRVFGKTLINGPGMSEASFFMKVGLTNKSMRIRVPGTVRIVDEQGNDTKIGEPGELLFRGDNMFAGYWESPGVIDRARRNGWFHTGDLVYMDERQDIWFVSRKKEIIVRNGENIAPVEIEQRLLDHPFAADAAVIGVPDGALGERIVGFMKLTDEAGDPAPKDVLRSLSSVLADYKIPEFLFFVDQIPRTAWGKVERRKLKAIAAEYFR